MNRLKKVSLALAAAVAVTAVPAGAYADPVLDEGNAASEAGSAAYVSALESGGIGETGDGSLASEDNSGESGTADDQDSDTSGTPDNGSGASDLPEQGAEADGQSDNEDQVGDEADGGLNDGNDINSVPSAPSVTARLNTTDHMKYMNGSSDGLFHPDSSLTKAEAASIINSLIASASAPVKNVSFDDVDSAAWYAQAVQNLASYGIINGNGGKFRPNAYISRAEFIKLLSSFSAPAASEKSFTDLPSGHWAHDIILSAAEKGWITGYTDGQVHPDGTMSRAEAAVMVNRVLGRIPDTATISSSEDIRIFPDVDEWHWAYNNIMEASIGHEYLKSGASETWTSFTKEGTLLPAGTHLIDGVLYCVDQSSGDFVRNQYVDGHWYDSDGRYVTGNVDLDELIREATRECVSSGMTQHQMLKSAFDYVVNNFRYLPRAKLNTGDTGWTESYAIPMFQTHKGNCYSFAAVYYYLAKNIGYNPKEVAGLVGHNRRPHGWIEIVKDGTTYIYDTELTMAKRMDGYNYYLFEMTYGNAPFIYAKR